MEGFQSSKVTSCVGKKTKSWSYMAENWGYLLVHFTCFSGWWFQTWLDYFPFHIWDVILPIDELHHFSRWLSHHQPVFFFRVDPPFFWRDHVDATEWQASFSVGKVHPLW